MFYRGIKENPAKRILVAICHFQPHFALGPLLCFDPVTFTEQTERFTPAVEYCNVPTTPQLISIQKW